MGTAPCPFSQVDWLICSCSGKHASSDQVTGLLIRYLDEARALAAYEVSAAVVSEGPRGEGALTCWNSCLWGMCMCKGMSSHLSSALRDSNLEGLLLTLSRSWTCRHRCGAHAQP